MSFDAKVFRIVIASPSDVEEERNVIPEIIHEWNSMNSFSTKVILLPIKWETHSAPMLGDRPQAIINQQLVLKDCDMLVGIFWTRIGTDTGVAISGTVEEIEQFVNSKKPVMLYFSKVPIDPEKINLEQFTVLTEFKEKMRLEGLVDSYENIFDFKQKFSRQLSFNVAYIIENALSNETETIEKQTPKNSNKKVKTDSAENTAKIEPSVIEPAEVKKPKLSEKAINEYLRKAVISASDEMGWARIASVGAYLQTYTPIDYKEFGHTKLQPFLIATNLFEFKTEKGHPILRLLPRKVTV